MGTEPKTATATVRDAPVYDATAHDATAREATAQDAVAQDAPRSGSTRRSSPRATVGAVLTALLLGTLLSGPGLVTAATGLPLGPVRDLAMAAASATERAAATIGLDGPRHWLTAVRDRGPGVALGVARPDDAPRDPSGSTEAAAGAAAGSRVTDDPATADADPGRPGERTLPGDVQRRSRPITPEAPLEVLLVGDSLIGAIADGFGRLSTDRDLVRWDKDVRISTGLARPDVLDWHRHLEQLLAARDPDVVVVMLGGNDDQSLVGTDGSVLHYGQAGWQQGYEERVARLQDIAAGAGRTVVWLELPAMRPVELDEARQIMNAAVRRAAARTGVTVLGTSAIISPEGYVARIDGTRVRAEDGVHLTQPGGDRVAVAVDELLTRRYGLPAG